MILYKENFFDLSEEQRKNKCNQIYLTVSDLSRKREFELIVQEIKKDKTWEQMRAIYKLFQLSLPHFKEWKPNVDWDLKKIKEFAKAELNYTRPITPYEAAMLIKQRKDPPIDNTEKESMYDFYLNQLKNISFADFTKEQAYNFVNDFEVWAQTPDQKTKKLAWSDVYLTNAEKEAYWDSLESVFKTK